MAVVVDRGRFERAVAALCEASSFIKSEDGLLLAVPKDLESAAVRLTLGALTALWGEGVRMSDSAPVSLLELARIARVASGEEVEGGE